MQPNKMVKKMSSLTLAGIIMAGGCLSCLNTEAALKLQDRAQDSGNFIFEQDPLALVSSINLIFYTGGIHDPAGKEGLTNLAFDALLRGTKEKTRDQFAAAIEGLGATIESSTGYNRTTLSLYAISENLEAAIHILAEAVLQPGLREQDFKTLKNEKLSLLNQARSRVSGVLFRALRQEMYRSTPLAHTVEGTIESLQRINLAATSDFLKKQIRSGNVFIAVNSNVEKEKVKRWLEKYFQEMPEGKANPLPSLLTMKKNGRHLLIVDRKGLTTVNTALAHPSIASTYPRLAELEVGNFVLGGGSMSNRLFNILRKENGWTYGAQSGFFGLDVPRRYGGAFVIYTFPATEHFLKAIPRAVEIYEDFFQNGATEEELQFAKNSLINSYAFEFASANDRIMNRVREALDGTKFYTMEEYRQHIQSLSASELKKILADALDPKNFTLAVAGDPDQLKKLQDLIPGIKSVTVVKDPIQKLW